MRVTFVCHVGFVISNVSSPSRRARTLRESLAFSYESRSAIDSPMDRRYHGHWSTLCYSPGRKIRPSPPPGEAR